MVSHDLRKGYELCTHALVMARGAEVYAAAKDDISFDEFERLYLDTVGMGVS